MTEERDSAISQLSAAHLSIEKLKNENSKLVRQNNTLHAKVAADNSNERHLTQEQILAMEHPETLNMKSAQMEQIRPRAVVAGPKKDQRVTDMRSWLGAIDAGQLSNDVQPAVQMSEAAKTQVIPRRSARAEPHVTDLFPRVEPSQKRDFSFEPSQHFDVLDREVNRTQPFDHNNQTPLPEPPKDPLQEETPESTNVSQRSVRALQ